VEEGKETDGVDIALDVSVVVMSTLQDVASLPPILGLSEAVGAAVAIIAIVQKARGNKDGFKKLAEDSTELVYAITRAHKDITRPEDVPADLTENLENLARTLTSIQKFAKKGASRGFLKAILRAGVDAGKIQDFREKLKQSMRVFGLQSDISLRDTVHKLAEQQVEIMEGLMNRGGTDSGAEPGAAPLPRPVGGKFAPLVNSAHGEVKITTIAGDKISNKVSKTKTNNNSYNMMTNSTVNTGNTTTTVTNTYH